MKRLFALLIAVIAACFVFGGCGNSSGNTPTSNGTTSTTDSTNTTDEEKADNATTDDNTDTGTADSATDGSEGGSAEDSPEQPAESVLPDDSEQEVKAMYLTVNGNKLEVTPAQNAAVDALIERLKQGDITYTANDYGGFEKVGAIGFDLPTSDEYITTQAGDVMLYVGSNIVIFYGSNSWDYTRLGKIKGYTASELRALLGTGSVQITVSLK